MTPNSSVLKALNPTFINNDFFSDIDCSMCKLAYHFYMSKIKQRQWLSYQLTAHAIIRSFTEPKLDWLFK